MPHKSHRYQPASRVLGGGVALALATLGLQVAVPSAAPRASAASSLLCAGFSDCANKGYSDSGYHAHWGHMYWRMYSGRNCVNYTAYRMVEAGLPDVRPWRGSGNATNWGVAMRSVTDHTPVVGSIAWWRGGAPGASALGHVAYVERVVSPGEIVVSESNYGSDFDWRVVTTSLWPSGFIHFRDAVMRNTAAPAINGVQRIRSHLTVTPGTWSVPTATLAYQWLADGQPIAGYTGTSFYPSRSYVGKRISVRVTASAPGYRPLSVVAPATYPLGPGLLLTLLNPTIKGTPEVDQPLTVSGAIFKPGVASKTVQWYADGQPIAGANALTFTPGQDQIGKRISASFTGHRDGFEPKTLTAAPTAPITAKPFTLTKRGSVTGTPRAGQTLRATPGEFAPNDATVSYRWLRDGYPIEGAAEATYAAGSADVGHHLSVQVVLRHKGYRDYAQTFAVPGIVTTVPWLHLRTTGLAAAARVHVRVIAPGVASPTGLVTILIGKHETKARLVDGGTTVRVDGLFRGLRRVKVSYAGAGVVLPSTKITTVRVFRASAAGTRHLG